MKLAPGKALAAPKRSEGGSKSGARGKANKKPLHTFRLRRASAASISVFSFPHNPRLLDVLEEGGFLTPLFISSC